MRWRAEAARLPGDGVNKVINPDSTVLQQVDGQWQKLAALILWKLKGREVVRITGADIEKMRAEFAPGVAVVFTHGLSDAIEFSIVDEAAAARLAEHDKTLRGQA